MSLYKESLIKLATIFIIAIALSNYAAAASPAVPEAIPTMEEGAEQEGTLTVLCEGQRLPVEIDGVAVGVCEEAINLPVGKHLLVVSQKQTGVFEQMVNIELGQVLNVKVVFQRLDNDLTEVFQSPNKVYNKLKTLDKEIQVLREKYKSELKGNVVAIFEKRKPLVNQWFKNVKDEYESGAEFNKRQSLQKSKLDDEELSELTVIQKEVEAKYYKEIAPLESSLKRLTEKHLIIEDNELEIGVSVFNPETGRFTVSIASKTGFQDKAAIKKGLDSLAVYDRRYAKAKESAEKNRKIIDALAKKASKPGKAGFMNKKELDQLSKANAAYNTSIAEMSNCEHEKAFKEKQIRNDNMISYSIQSSLFFDRDEAREFKTRYNNKQVKARIIGRLNTTRAFIIDQAVLIDQITQDEYSLFESRFVQINGGNILDTKANILWSKINSSENRYAPYFAFRFVFGLNNSNYMGFSDWRLPTEEELATLISYAKNGGYGSRNYPIYKYLSDHNFNFIPGWYWSSTKSDSEKLQYKSYSMIWGNEFTRDHEFSGATEHYATAVRTYH